MSKRAHKKSKFQKEPKEFLEEVIQISRVTRVQKGGRVLRFRATVAIGNKKGKVGVGIGKSHEVTGAIKKAIAKAKKELIEVPIDRLTIPHDIKITYKSAKIIFLPAGPGTGIIAGGPIRKVIELAGYKNILSKAYGTSNKINNTKATYEALKLLKETPIMKKIEKDAKAKNEEKKQATLNTKKPDNTKEKKAENTKPIEKTKPKEKIENPKKETSTKKE